MVVAIQTLTGLAGMTGFREAVPAGKTWDRQALLSASALPAPGQGERASLASCLGEKCRLMVRKSINGLKKRGAEAPLLRISEVPPLRLGWTLQS